MSPEHEWEWFLKDAATPTVRSASQVREDALAEDKKREAIRREAIRRANWRIK
jgi:hypothetical protein